MEIQERNPIGHNEQKNHRERSINTMNINFIWCSFIHSNFLLDQLSRSTLILTHAYIQRYLPWSWPSFCCFWSEWCVCVLCKMQVIIIIIIIPQMVKFRWNPSLSIDWCLLVGMVFCFKFFFFFTFDHHHHCFNWPCVFVFVRGPTNKRKKKNVIIEFWWILWKPKKTHSLLFLHGP